MAQLDVYASSFVPQWLKDINDAPAQLVFATAPTDFEVRFDEYTRTFAGSSLLGDGGLALMAELGSLIHTVFQWRLLPVYTLPLENFDA